MRAITRFIAIFTLMLTGCGEAGEDHPIQTGDVYRMTSKEIRSIPSLPQSIGGEQAFQAFMHLEMGWPKEELSSGDPEYWMEIAISKGYNPALRYRGYGLLSVRDRESCAEGFELLERIRKSGTDEASNELTFAEDIEFCRSLLAS